MNVPAAGPTDKAMGIAFDALKANEAAFLDTMFKATGFFLLALGWLLTSEKSRDLLGGNAVAKYAALLAILLIAATHVWVLIERYRRSLAILALLASDSATGPYYRLYAVTTKHLISGLLVNLALAAVLFIVICTLPVPAGPR